MLLKLKNIKHTSWASEETHCYQASLYVDGKPVAVLSNDGHGGCDRDYSHPKFKGDYRAKMNEINDHFKSLPPSPFSYEGANGVMIHDSLDQSLESWCSDQVNNWLSEKELKRNLKSHVLMQIKGKDGIYQTKFHPTVTKGEWVINKHSGQTRRILNDMDFSDALTLWKESA
tara:strand:+ start:147 stop:662 length:516 start_codon:yes stop_codon:yes gene_type:complete